MLFLSSIYHNLTMHQKFCIPEKFILFFFSTESITITWTLPINWWWLDKATCLDRKLWSAHCHVLILWHCYWLMLKHIRIWGIGWVRVKKWGLGQGLVLVEQFDLVHSQSLQSRNVFTVKCCSRYVLKIVHISSFFSSINVTLLMWHFGSNK